MQSNKSRKLCIASWLVGLIGCGACAIGAIAYMIMHFAGYQLIAVGPFKWAHLYIVAAAAGVFILVAVALRIASNLTREKATVTDADDDEILDDTVEDENEEDACKECDENCDECDENCEVSDENCEETESDKAAETVPEKKNVIEIIKGKLTPENKEKIVKTVKKAAPVIVAVAATAIVTSAIHKAAAEKRQAKIRKSIFDLLR